MRKLCCFAIPFSAAIFLAIFLLPESVLLPAAVIGVSASLTGLFFHGTRRLRMVLIAFGWTAGLLWTAGYRFVFYDPARQLDGAEGILSATVIDWPQRTRFGSSVLVELHPIQGPDIKTLISASNKMYAELKPGDEITCSAVLHLADVSYGEETEFYHARGIFLLADAREVLSVRPASRISIQFLPALVARRLKESAAQCFDTETAPLVIALTTGDKRSLPGGLYSAFQRTGLAHTVAVSGLHVSFLAGCTAALLGRGRRSAVVSILLLAFFAAMTGASPSVLRAAFLQCLLLTAPLIGREYDPPSALSAALMLLLLCNPYAAASVGLQLSFASVAGIWLITGPLTERWTAGLPARPKAPLLRLGCEAARFCASSFATTLGALLFTTPLTCYYFGSFSLIAPLSNLISLWAVSLAFLGGLLTSLLGIVFPAAGQIAASVAALPVRYLNWLAPLLAKIPFAALPLDEPCLALWLGMCYLVALLYLLVREKPKRPVIPLSACVVVLCAGLLCTSAAAGGGRLTVSVLDVGQGESVLFYSGGRTALVDCGGSGRTDPGDIAAGAVQRLGKSRLDLLILTHCHTDHAGGVPELLARLKVDVLLLPDAAPEEESTLRQEILTLAEAQGTQILFVREDLEIALGDSSLKLYAPLGYGSTNESGLSVLCSAGDFDSLVTGDMDAEIEAELVQHGDLPQVELLVAGHHGAATSTSPVLLEAIQPGYAAISVGYNHYGHPAPEVLSRLTQAGCQVFRTDWMGTIRFTISPP